MQFRSHANIDAHARQQIDIIDLVLNDIAIVDHRTPLLVNLRANDVALVIHLVAAVAGVVLAVAQIETLVAAVSLVGSDEIRGIAAAATIALVKKLIIPLHAYHFALAADLVASITGVVLVEAMIHARISGICLVAPHEGCVVSAAADSMVALIVLLVRSRSRKRHGHGRRFDMNYRQKCDQNTCDNKP